MPRYFCHEMISLKDNTIIKQAMIQTQIPFTTTHLSQLNSKRRERIISDSYNGKTYILQQVEMTRQVYETYIEGIPIPKPTPQHMTGTFNQATQTTLQPPMNMPNHNYNLSILADITSRLPYQ